MWKLTKLPSLPVRLLDLPALSLGNKTSHVASVSFDKELLLQDKVDPVSLEAWGEL